MEPRIVIKENWLTKKPTSIASLVTFVFTLLVLVTSLIYFRNSFHAQSWMSANQVDVFVHHQWWRAWTALFVHADFLHLLSNAVLLVPLTFLLSGYFGVLFFPIFAVFVGGLINLLVLLTLPAQTSLLGISGVVYWMGAAWLTLYLLIDTRDNLRRRFAHALFLSVILFIPETYKPQISYLSHLFGFIAGTISGFALFALRHKQFIAAEVKEYIYDEDPALELANCKTCE